MYSRIAFPCPDHVERFRYDFHRFLQLVCLDVEAKALFNELSGFSIATGIVETLCLKLLDLAPCWIASWEGIENRFQVTASVHPGVRAERLFPGSL